MKTSMPTRSLTILYISGEILTNILKQEEKRSYAGSELNHLNQIQPNIVIKSCVTEREPHIRTGMLCRFIIQVEFEMKVY